MLPCLHNVPPQYDENGYLRCPICLRFVEFG